MEGIATFPGVEAIGDPVEIVTLCVPPRVGARLLSGIATKSPRELWINPGAESAELLAEAARLGLHTRPLCSILALGRAPGEFSGQ